MPKPRKVASLRALEILDYIRAFVGANGVAPTFSEIGDYFGFTSPATVHKHLENLAAAGLIRRKWNHARAIELTGACPHCGAESRP